MPPASQHQPLRQTPHPSTQVTVPGAVLLRAPGARKACECPVPSEGTAGPRSPAANSGLASKSHGVPPGLPEPCSIFSKDREPRATSPGHVQDSSLPHISKPSH